MRIVILLLFVGLSGLHAAERDWTNASWGRSRSLSIPTQGAAGFTRLSAVDTGINFTNRIPQERHLTNQIVLNGSGVTAGDVDGDGWADLFFASLGGRCALYRNLGNGRFDEIAEKAGVALAGLDSSGCLLADLDGDGDVDLLVNTLTTGTQIFLNDGKGHFTPAPGSPYNLGRGPTSAAVADVDGDGKLDIYVANYRTVTLRDQPNTKFNFKMGADGKVEVTSIGGLPITHPDVANRFNVSVREVNGRHFFNHDENGEADLFLRGLGGGRFAAQSLTNGLFQTEEGQSLPGELYDWGLSASFRDLNGDGWPDLYVCNDFRSPDRIWLNDGRGHLRAAPPLAFRKTSLSSMGVDMADLDGDGRPEVFVVDMLSRSHERNMIQRVDTQPEVSNIGEISNRPQTARNTLFHNRGDGTFAEIAHYAGLDAAEWAWVPAFMDVDLDGLQDLLITNGFERDGMNMDVVRQLEVIKSRGKMTGLEQIRLRELFPRLATPNLAYRNLGGLRFADQSAAWGFNAAEISQGMALVDLDNDGDLDLVINNFNGGAAVYRNNATAPRLSVRLRGQSPNTAGIGALITITSGSLTQAQEIVCGGRYLSSDDLIRTFAALHPTNRMRIEVTWRSGRRTVVPEAEANRHYEINEPAGPSPAPEKRELASPTPLFRDVSATLGHQHHEEPFDDFETQPLLPARLSQSGPGVSWFDFDGDGREDLFIGSGKGGRLGAFRNLGGGRFESLNIPPFAQPVTRDQTTVLGLIMANGERQILAGSANLEDGFAAGSVARTYRAGNAAIADSLPGQASTTGPMALGDLHGDGTLALFVGGRVVPGRYPEPPSSLIFRQKDNAWSIDTENTRAVAEAGLVSGAVWSDLDGDGFPELILACEWGPVRVYRNTRGRLKEATGEWGLAGFTGLWNGVAAGDFDGDGRMDLVVSNCGRNTRYEHYGSGPIELFYGDFNGDQTVVLVEASFDTELAKVVPHLSLDDLARSMPFLRARYPTLQSFSRESVESILGDRAPAGRKFEMTTRESVLLLNRGGRFERRVLPMKAQWSPAFALCVADFDGDGRDDLFLSQNFFALSRGVARYDSGQGLLLLGDGQGGFRSVPAQESGLRIDGEQRGAAVADYDADGRVDLVVAQNGAATRLFLNTQGKPGLRVRLNGPTGNREGVGARLRLIQEGKAGPAREVAAGSGYWSQNGAVQVLGSDGARPISVEVLWPGGARYTHTLKETDREITITAPVQKP